MQWSIICRQDSLDASQDVRRKKVQQLLSEIQQSSQIGGAVDIGTAVFKTTINLISNTIFSVDLVQSAGTAGVQRLGDKYHKTGWNPKLGRLFSCVEDGRPARHKKTSG